MPFWAPTLRGEERVRDKPGGESEEGKVRRLPPCMYTDFSFLSHNSTCNFQMDRNGLASFCNPSLQMVRQKANKTLPSKEDTQVLKAYENLLRERVELGASVPWDMMTSEPCLQVPITSGEVVSTIRRAQKVLVDLDLPMLCVLTTSQTCPRAYEW